MPNLVPVVLTDRAPTPVDHTFNPRDISNGVATLSESTGIPIGERRITMAHTRSQNGRIRATIKITVPVVQDVEVNGVTRATIVKTNYADLTFNFDNISTAQERADVVSFVEELCQSSQTMVNKFLVDLEGLY